MSDPWKKNLGSEGEQIAGVFLERLGYQRVTSNFSTRWGEIDLVMRDGTTWVFVEVKLRRDATYGEPEEAITPAKMRHLTKAALFYLQRARLQDVNVRFDVVSVGPQGIRHTPDAFSVEHGNYY